MDSVDTKSATFGISQFPINVIIGDQLFRKLHKKFKYMLLMFNNSQTSMRKKKLSTG